MTQALSVLDTFYPVRTEAPKTVDISAYGGGGYAGYNRVFITPFDGEKSAGGIGPINKYVLDYEALRLRSWQLLLESEIVQIGISRSVMWTVGSGLKLRCQPDKDVLESEGIKIEPQKWAKTVEGRFRLFAGNRFSDWADMESLHQKVWEIEKNALVGGDCLVIINVVDGIPKVELKDGAHVRTPLFNLNMNGVDIINPETKNRIRHGVEIDSRGQHVAFYVKRYTGPNNGGLDYMNYDRIPARDPKTGIVRAFLYYGIRYRLDDIRGIPLISVCMETTKQLDLYKEATVSGAVERAKIAFSIEHELGGTGTNPMADQIARGLGGAFSDIPKDINNQNLSNQFAATTGRQAINLPNGAEIKMHDSKQEVHFGEFYETNISIVFAALDIPKEVALMMFGSNYSASRAAIKDWAHTLTVRREMRVKQFYQPIYEIWLLTQILQNKVQAPGYLEAIVKKNVYVTAAYTSAKWQGDNVPNIDEKKEVDAVRNMLGAGSIHMPLITLEEGIERLNGGEFEHTTEQYQTEIEYGDELGIEKVEPKGTVIEDFGEDGEDKPKKKGEKSDPTKNQGNKKNKTATK